ncbi:uncharacterized protein METZ01_LOCUS350751 [marine metagenome]|uniref:Guanylate cyclase domain-containing protein n=1 Tax=marine metagenome TaxID=408172 RepID=A0A382RLA0_9ZZZZ
MPSSDFSKKKLKAIVFTDIANFTKLSAYDEQKALDLIQKQNEIIKPIVEKHNGEWLKEIGDGLLLSFESSLEAVRCSIEIQKTLNTIDDLNIRIGIHQGDIFIKDGDVFGDDVNITSRIESFSPIGGISISDKVNKDILSVLEIKTSFVGHKKLKGVKQDTKIYCIKVQGIVRHRVQLLPLISGFILVSVGILGIFTLLGLYFGAIVMDETRPLDTYLKSLFRMFAFIIFGYTSIMYVRGISAKTHKYLVYSSYFVIIIWILALLAKEFG